ncbi:MAG TPA: hypothetical protein VGP77_09690 [Vicinamibacterales bacterium]|jgi:photosystem II stability/assembly factor-like uncharacterized protein|nr:hypothetical protein [Vicinamibacterales bacterium]
MEHRLAPAAAFVLAGALTHAGVLAHDSGLSNGLFRSRDGGATWLQLDAGSFANGALALAVHPTNAHRLLLATDGGLVSSRNGGRDWESEASNVLSGPAFAVAFDLDGAGAMASGANALYRFDGNRWLATRTPAGSAPARVLASGGVAGRAYLAGWTGLHRTDNWGRSWARVGKEIDAESVSALAISANNPDDIHALAGGRVWTSTDGARSWRADAGTPQTADALAFDGAVPTRLWIVAAGRAYRKQDRTSRWEPVGEAIPDPQAKARGIDVLNDAMVISTDRGVYRSLNAGVSWALLSAELPNHVEATLLLRDPHNPATIYAGFSRLGPEQLKGVLLTPDQSFTRSDVALLVGLYSGFALVLVGVGVIVRRMTREGTAAKGDRAIDDMRAESP